MHNPSPTPPTANRRIPSLAIPNHGNDIGGVDLPGVIVLLEEAGLGGEVETAGEAGPVVDLVPVVAGAARVGEYQFQPVFLFDA